jgi:hypothetical protein
MKYNSGGKKDATGFEYRCKEEKTPSNINDGGDKKFCNKVKKQDLIIKGGSVG